jgi:hypothetical protein
MQFCAAHWTTLRQALAARGIDHLVAKGGEAATAKQLDQLVQREETRENFDPLMSAHWAILGNVMMRLERAGGRDLGLYIMFGGKDICPLCAINTAHKDSCTDPRCGLDKERGYDWMIDTAADEQLAAARKLGLVPGVQ